MAQPSRASTFTGNDHVYVIVETPAGCRTKYAWDPKLRAFVVSKLLPIGFVFPYDFGLIPDTKSADGDPLDAMVLSDEPLAVGAVVECRVLGVLEIATSEPGSTKLERNDRILVVPVASLRGAAWRDISDLGPLVIEIAEFFRGYTLREGRKFELIANRDRTEAISIVRGKRH